MKSFAVPAVFATVASAATPESTYQAAWLKYKADYGKDYSNGDEDSRYGIFKANFDIIEETNAKHLSYTLGINEFADLSLEEFSATHFGLKAPSNVWGSLKNLGTHEYHGEPLADALDWVEKGAVTPVKNQGQCGSCWSFSTTGALEGAYFGASGSLVSLSEQQFVDCDHTDHGCQGGLMDYGFTFAKKNDICTEETYPYHSGTTKKSGTCKASSCSVGLAKGRVTGFIDVPSDSAEAFMSALALGPVAIAIEADKPAFQMYNGGVVTSTACGTQLDHGVLCVGYGTDNGQDYWKVKNSWGGSWGEEGYIRLGRGIGASGECGLLKQASYPVISKGPAPPPGPAPPAPPAPPAGTHYEAPPCADDETALTLQGKGSYCAPSCDNACPAPGKCTVHDQSGNQYCGLECNILDSCPDGMSCSGVLSGICLWPEAIGLNGRQVVESKKEVVV